jgi:mRNA interferase YafQ
MRTPVYTKRFEKDLKLMVKRGYDPENIKAVIRDLIEGKPLDRKCQDHVLIGNFKDH